MAVCAHASRRHTEVKHLPKCVFQVHLVVVNHPSQVFLQASINCNTPQHTTKWPKSGQSYTRQAELGGGGWGEFTGM